MRTDRTHTLIITIKIVSLMMILLLRLTMMIILIIKPITIIMIRITMTATTMMMIIILIRIMMMTMKILQQQQQTTTTTTAAAAAAAATTTLLTLKAAIRNNLQSPQRATRTVSITYAHVIIAQSRANPVQYIRHISRATCRVPRGTKGQLSYYLLQLLRSHSFSVYFIGFLADE